jgi:hypothetical protein
MKDEFDIYTKDMFGKQTSKPITDPDARQFSKTLSVQEEAPSRPPKKHREEAKEAPKKVTSKPIVGPSGSGASLEKGMMGGRFKPTLHAKGGMVSSASKRADGIAVKGKTKGKYL